MRKNEKFSFEESLSAALLPWGAVGLNGGLSTLTAFCFWLEFVVLFDCTFHFTFLPIPVC